MSSLDSTYSVGVDEAGKGPVLGSMYVVAAYVPDSPAGLRDSKRLSPERRRELASTLRSDEDNEFEVVEVSADEVDAYVDGDGTTMNDLVVDAHASALQGLDVPDVAVVDASDTSESRFQEMVSRRVENDVVAEHGADDLHAAVAAASVVAKVERDRHVDEIGERYDVDVGSGYPGDSRTLGFLKDYLVENGSLPSEVRCSWDTCRRLEAEVSQAGFDDF
ncbi:MAG: ribonuclease HII [Halobacteriota archaeon]